MSKLGLHISAGNRRGFGDYLVHCTAAGSPVPVVFSLDQDVWPDLQRYSPQTVLVFRTQHTLEQETIGDGPGSMYEGDPIQTARDWMDLLWPVWQLNKAHYYAPLNEQDPATLEHCKWINTFTLECMKIGEKQGRHLALYAFSAGNPKDLIKKKQIETTWKQCAQELLPSLRRAKANGHLLLLHEYGLDRGTLQASAPWLALRYRTLYEFLPKNARPWLVISEAGAGNGFAGIAEHVFLDDAAWYDSELVKDPWVIGACLYQLGGAENLVKLLPKLADHIAAHPTPRGGRP